MDHGEPQARPAALARGRAAPPGPDRKRRRTRTEDSQRLRAVHPNQVWAIDFQFDSTHDGRQLKSLHVVDEHTREALAMRDLLGYAPRTPGAT